METAMLNHRKRRPTHPGEVLREDVLPAAGINQTQLARMLRVSRRTVNEIVQEKRGVSADMAHRLARVFTTTPDVWLNMQKAVDIWDALEANRREYERIKPLQVA
ncbi:MAG TPA: HigA family addiction module antitoxin [Blastocatellia bacterium]|nr:HigA family addiction module antitoxin [Blastocatellia bacterium]